MGILFNRHSLEQHQPDPIILRAHSDSVNVVAINDKWVVRGSDDKTAHLWNLEQPQAEPIVLPGHSSPITGPSSSIRIMERGPPPGLPGPRGPCPWIDGE